MIIPDIDIFYIGDRKTMRFLVRYVCEIWLECTNFLGSELPERLFQYFNRVTFFFMILSKTLD
jgi:hypothetical protein